MFAYDRVIILVLGRGSELAATTFHCGPEILTDPQIHFERVELRGTTPTYLDRLGEELSLFSKILEA